MCWRKPEVPSFAVRRFHVQTTEISSRLFAVKSAAPWKPAVHHEARDCLLILGCGASSAGVPRIPLTVRLGAPWRSEKSEKNRRPAAVFYFRVFMLAETDGWPTDQRGSMIDNRPSVSVERKKDNRQRREAREQTARKRENTEGGRQGPQQRAKGRCAG